MIIMEEIDVGLVLLSCSVCDFTEHLNFWSAMLVGEGVSLLSQGGGTSLNNLTRQTGS